MSTSAPSTPSQAIETWLHQHEKGVATHPDLVAEVALIVNPLVDADALSQLLRGKYKASRWPQWRQALFHADRVDLIEAMETLGHRWKPADLIAAFTGRAAAPHCVRALLSRPSVVPEASWNPPPPPAPTHNNTYHRTPTQNLLAHALNHPCWEEVLAHPSSSHPDALDEAAHHISPHLLPTHHHRGWFKEFQQVLAKGACLHRPMDPWADSLRPSRHFGRRFGDAWAPDDLALPPRTACSIMLESLIDRPPDRDAPFPVDVLALVQREAVHLHPWFLLDALGELNGGPRCTPSQARALVQAFSSGLHRRHPEWGVAASQAMAASLLRQPEWSMTWLRGSDPWEEADIHRFLQKMLPLVLDSEQKIGVSRLGAKEQWLEAPFIPEDLRPLWQRVSYVLRGAGNRPLSSAAARQRMVEEILLEWNVAPVSNRPNRPRL